LILGCRPRNVRQSAMRMTAASLDDLETSLSEPINSLAIGRQWGGLWWSITDADPVFWGRGPRGHSCDMTKYRNYWLFSIGCFVVWGVILAVVAAQGKGDKTNTVLLVFGGWVIAWVSGTAARFVYPPPKRWLPPDAPASRNPAKGL
jgi:hypothetical protein